MEENEDTLLAEYGLDPSGQPVAEQPEVEEAPEVETPEVEETGEEQAPQGIEDAQSMGDFTPLLEQLRAQGITSMDDIHAMMAQSQAQSQMQGELATLEASLQAAVENGDMTPEAAQMVYDAKAEALEAKATIQAQQMQLQMAQEAQAQQELAKISPELAQAVGQIGLAPEQIKALAGALNGALNTTKQKAVAEYVAGKKATSPAPISERGSGPKEEDIDPDQFSFSQLFEMAGR